MAFCFDNGAVVRTKQKEPMTARRLAAAMRISEVTVGRFIRALESAGWIERERDPNDGRAILVRLTERAYDELPRLIRVSNRMLDEAFDGFRLKDLEQMAEVVDRIRQNLEVVPSVTT